MAEETVKSPNVEDAKTGKDSGVTTYEIKLDPSQKIGPMIEEAKSHLEEGKKVVFRIDPTKSADVGMALATSKIITLDLSGKVKCHLGRNSLTCTPKTPAVND